MKCGYRELLKPPLVAREHYIFNGDGIALFMLSANAIGEIRKNEPSGEEIEKRCDELLEFGRASMNEKWERDFGEPLRWIWSGLGIGLDCPACGQSYAAGDTSKMMWDRYAYCSCCGQRLLPPEEA